MTHLANTTALAYEHNGRRIGREAFYAIACDPARSVAVEACAGAGKTWMLVSRILRALLEGAEADGQPRVQPHEILAITFTKKAAGEMRQRLHEWLAEFATAPPAQLQRALVERGVEADAAARLCKPLGQLYRRMLGGGRPVQVRTFHSWFAALLRTAPLAVLEQLGLPARHELLEDDAEAIDRIWRRFFVAVAADDQARADYEASVAAHGRTQTHKALTGALSKRVEFALADAHGVVEASIKPWPDVFSDLADGLPAGPASAPSVLLAQPGPVWEAFAGAARALGRASAPTFSAKGVQLEQALAGANLSAALDALLTQKCEPRKFNDKLAGIEAVRAAQALALRLNAACEQHEAWLHQQRLARLSRLLVSEFAALKREHGWVDMNDVERAALTLLSDPVLSGWMHERLDARVAHLLIDEFQDTNPLQWQALYAWLSGYAGAGAGSRPSVFIVGDPKQSIYRFRRAEPQVFLAAQRFVVEGMGGDLLSCDHTHRNAPEVLAAVNEVMAAAQAAGEYTGFRPHTTQARTAGRLLRLPPVPRPETGADAGPSDVEAETGAGLDWRDSLLTPREQPEERLVALESRQAAGWIAARLAAGLAPGELMVLARKRDRLAAMEAALRERGIPAQQPEKTDLSESPEVQDLVALLDVLVSPTHDLSLVRVLKSPLFGIGDAALVALALHARALQQSEARPVPWLELLQRHALPEPELDGVGATLMRWKGWVDRFPPHDALEAIYHDGDVLVRYAQAAPGPLREAVLARLRALLGAALEVGGGRYATPYGFVRALKSGRIPGPALAEAQAVRLLTVHGAKGLEAPVVLLLDTDAPAARAETMGVIVEWPGEAPAPWRFAFLASETRAPACSAEALEVERAARQREELNALYVAMTRARRELVISCVEPHQPAEGSWWRRLAPLCEPAELTDASGHAPDRASDAFTLRYVPLAPAGAAAAPADKVAEPAASADAVFGRALHRLLELRPAAAAPGEWPAALRQRVAREFALAPTRLADVVAMADRMLSGEGAWAWDAAAIDWQRNEVELHHHGELLRLDRLVRRRADGQWWVLDYKSAARPQHDAALLDQMRRYRAAMQAAHPGATVQVAFLTGQGRLVCVE